MLCRWSPPMTSRFFTGWPMRPTPCRGKHFRSEAAAHDHEGRRHASVGGRPCRRGGDARARSCQGALTRCSARRSGQAAGLVQPPVDLRRHRRHTQLRRWPPGLGHHHCPRGRRRGRVGHGLGSAVGSALVGDARWRRVERAVCARMVRSMLPRREPLQCGTRAVACRGNDHRDPVGGAAARVAQLRAAAVSSARVDRAANASRSTRRWSPKGRLDASIIVLGGIWDFAATSLIVREAGGVFRDAWGGERLDTATGVFTNAALIDAVLRRLAEVRPPAPDRAEAGQDGQHPDRHTGGASDRRVASVRHPPRWRRCRPASGSWRRRRRSSPSSTNAPPNSSGRSSASRPMESFAPGLRSLGGRKVDTQTDRRRRQRVPASAHSRPTRTGDLSDGRRPNGGCGSTST